MKKALLLVIVAIMTYACNTSKTVIQSKKVIKGEWVLNSVSYDQTGHFNTKLFNDASQPCFEGSTWRFIPNNNTGTYTINGGDCASGERYFIFTIQEMDAETGLYDFLLKPTNEKGKSETNAGFRLRLAQLSGTNMRWDQTVSLEGSPLTISMNFTKL